MTYQKAQSLLFPPPGMASLNTESFVALMDGLPALGAEQVGGPATVACFLMPGDKMRHLAGLTLVGGKKEKR